MKTLHLLVFALALSLVTIGQAQASSYVSLEITAAKDFSPDPVSVKGSGGENGASEGEFSVNLSVYEDRKENEPAVTVHQKYTVTTGKSSDDSNAISVEVSDPGFTKKKVAANKWTLEKDGMNTGPVTITVKCSFATTGKDKLVTVDGEVTLSDGSKANDKGEAFLDCYNLTDVNERTYVNATKGNYFPYKVPPYGADAKGMCEDNKKPQPRQASTTPTSSLPAPPSAAWPPPAFPWAITSSSTWATMTSTTTRATKFPWAAAPSASASPATATLFTGTPRSRSRTP
jgi:hypothetical protein